MTEWTSLFARKLRAHRARQGDHGRMTQEELAEALGVSVDAIGKYERSLSFIRGDLEHRLVECLGWSREDVLACRQDWEAGRKVAGRPGYRLLYERDILQEFGGSARDVNRAVAAMECGGVGELPDGFSASDAVWGEILNEGALTGVYVMHGSDLVGHVALVFPDSDLEQRFHDRSLEEGALSPDYLKRPILPGTYFAYCPAVYVARGHEAAARPLLSGFVKVLEELADREIFVREIGAIACNPLGRQLCEELDLTWLGKHRHHPSFGMWILPGERIATSIMGRKSPKLRQAYLLPAE